MRKIFTLEEIGKITHWGLNGAFFNSQQKGFPEPIKGYLFNAEYDLDEIIEWDRTRPVAG
jgi:hypothetical protein